MLDPSYRDGVTPDSVTRMIDDIVGVYMNKTSQVSLPDPVSNVGPATYMSFKQDSSEYPTDLKISRQSQKSARSRRVRSYNMQSGNSSLIQSNIDLVNNAIDDLSLTVSDDKDDEYTINDEKEINEDDDYAIRAGKATKIFVPIETPESVVGVSRRRTKRFK